MNGVLVVFGKMGKDIRTLLVSRIKEVCTKYWVDTVLQAADSSSNPKLDRFFILTRPEECVTQIDGLYHIRFVCSTLRLLQSHQHFDRCFRTDGHYKIPLYDLVGMWTQTQDPLLKGYPGALQFSTTENSWAYKGLCNDVTVAVICLFVFPPNCGVIQFVCFGYCRCYASLA
jgi:hypothetical protein